MNSSIVVVRNCSASLSKPASCSANCSSAMLSASVGVATAVFVDVAVAAGGTVDFSVGVDVGVAVDVAANAAAIDAAVVVDATLVVVVDDATLGAALASGRPSNSEPSADVASEANAASEPTLLDERAAVCARCAASFAASTRCRI